MTSCCSTFDDDRGRLREARGELEQVLAGLGLRAKARATMLAPTEVGLPFLGWCGLRLDECGLRTDAAWCGAGSSGCGSGGRASSTSRGWPTTCAYPPDEHCGMHRADTRALDDGAPRARDHPRLAKALVRRAGREGPVSQPGDSWGPGDKAIANQVIRGGNFRNDARNARSAYRNRNKPDNRYPPSLPPSLPPSMPLGGGGRQAMELLVGCDGSLTRAVVTHGSGFGGTAVAFDERTPPAARPLRTTPSRSVGEACS